VRLIFLTKVESLREQDEDEGSNDEENEGDVN